MSVAEKTASQRKIKVHHGNCGTGGSRVAEEAVYQSECGG